MCGVRPYTPVKATYGGSSPVRSCEFSMCFGLCMNNNVVFIIKKIFQTLFPVILPKFSMMMYDECYLNDVRNTFYKRFHNLYNFRHN